MAGMALHAEERLCYLKQWFVGRAVRSVTVGAVFGDVGMLVNERTLVLHVAARAGVLDGEAVQTLILRGTMRIMAVGADHFVLGDWMMGELGKFHPDFLMTGEAELFLFMATDFLLWTLV